MASLKGGACHEATVSSDIDVGRAGRTGGIDEDGKNKCEKVPLCAGFASLRCRSGGAGVDGGRCVRSDGSHASDDRTPQETFRGGRIGRSAGAQKTGQAAADGDLRRDVRGAAGRVGLLRGAGGPKALDGAAARGESGRTELCVEGVPYDGAASLKKNELKPHLRKYWKIPPKESAAFVAAMEDVLAVYELPYDSQHPLVCMDESRKQLIGEVREAMRCEPGRPEASG